MFYSLVSCKNIINETFRRVESFRFVHLVTRSIVIDLKHSATYTMAEIARRKINNFWNVVQKDIYVIPKFLSRNEWKYR